MPKPPRRALACALLAFAPEAWAGELELHGFGAARAIEVESRTAWIDGGFGRLTEGEDASAFAALARGEAQLGVDWTPTPVLMLRVHGVARTEPGASGGERLGLTQAFLQYRPELRPDLALRVRAGLQFAETSRENTDALWQSPYTLTLSSLNSWIGEEFRPLGLDLALQLGEPGRSRVELAGMAFGGADTAGALLAWRGWGMGTRLSVVGETLPLPPLPTLGPGSAFGEQQRSGTRPIDEIDGRIGWQARARWSHSGVGLVQAGFTDTRGDRGLHDGQYAWATRFASAGAEAQLGPLRLVAEALAGETGMGAATAAHVDMRIRAAYALLSWAKRDGAIRLTARYDVFRNEDRDGTAEPNGESGWGVTAAGFWTPRPWLRLGVEYLYLEGDRPAAAFSGTPLDAGAERAQAELRLRF